MDELLNLKQRILELEAENLSLEAEINKHTCRCLETKEPIAQSSWEAALPYTMQGINGNTGACREVKSAEAIVSYYFKRLKRDVQRGKIEIFDQRYIFVRGAALGVEFFHLIKSLFEDDTTGALTFTRNLLFDLSLMIGKADCKAIIPIIPDPKVRKSSGAVYFAFIGWARVEILPGSSEEASNEEDLVVMFDHVNSFEAESYINSAMTPMPMPMCFMNCGYASGWVGEAWGISLVTVEILCKARGDSCCRFIMARPNNLLRKVHEYQQNHPELNIYTDYALPGFFERRTFDDSTARAKKSKSIGSALSDLQEQHLALESEREIGLNLLNNLFPEHIMEKLQQGEELIADRQSRVTVLFADVPNFLDITDSLDAEEVVRWLNDLFDAMDTLAEKYKLEKIKTIGASYLVACGISAPRENHIEATLNFALDLMDVVKDFTDPLGNQVQMCVGVSTGPVSCGVIGHKKYRFDIWGDCVNVASRMQTLCDPGKIQCTEAVQQAAKDKFEFVYRGCVPVKGKGCLNVFYCEGRNDTDQL